MGGNIFLISEKKFPDSPVKFFSSNNLPRIANQQFLQNQSKTQLGGGGAHILDTMDSILAFHPMALGSILGIPNNFSLDADEIN